MSKTTFNPKTDIPPLAGKVILITGGAATVEALAAHSPSHIYFTGRNAESAQALTSKVKAKAPEMNVTFIHLDMTSLDAVQAGLRTFTQSRLDILICNAGIGMNAQPEIASKDGYEIRFAVSHLAHALIIKTLLPTMLKTAKEPDSDVRIVHLSSKGFKFHPKEGIEFGTLKSPQSGMLWGSQYYSQSKLANLMYAAELAKRYPQIMSFSVHPGVVDTPMTASLATLPKAMIYLMNLGKLDSIEDGVKNQLWAAAGASREKLQNGGFYMPVGIDGQDCLTDKAKSTELGEELWRWTDEALKERS